MRLASPARPKLILTLVSALLPTLASASVTVTFRDGSSPPGYAGTRDVRISNGGSSMWDPTANYEGKGLSVGGGTYSRAVLMKWDLSPIPIAATITGVSLTLNITQDTDSQYPLYACLKPWVDTQATWNQYATGSTWTTPGAAAVAPTSSPDRGSTALNQDLLTASNAGPRTFNLNSAGIAVVQQWLSAPATNYGFVVPPTGGGETLSWSDAEDSTIANRPALTITYTGSGSGTVTLQNGVTISGFGTYTGTSDTAIANGPPPGTVNYSGQGLRVGGQTSSSNTLILFDLTTLPPWATVSSATLAFNVNQNTSQTYPVYQVLQPWDETQATWYLARSGTSWQVTGAGGSQDRGTTVLGTFAPAQDGTQTIALNNAGTQLVQDWVRGVQPNYGFILSQPANSESADMSDREDSTVANHPGLTVTYTEGQLVLSDPPSAPAGTPAMLGLQRQRLDGTPIDQGAPALALSLSTSSSTGGFALTPSPAAGWSPTLQVSVPAGASASPAVYYLDTAQGQVTLSTDAGPAWNAASQALVVAPPADGGTPPGVVVEPDGGLVSVDGGPAGPPVNLSVGCGCSSPGGLSALSLGLLTLLALARRRLAGR